MVLMLNCSLNGSCWHFSRVFHDFLRWFEETSTSPGAKKGIHKNLTYLPCCLKKKKSPDQRMECLRIPVPSSKSLTAAAKTPCPAPPALTPAVHAGTEGDGSCHTYPCHRPPHLEACGTYSKFLTRTDPRCVLLLR